MTKFEVYDTKGVRREVVGDIDLTELQVLLCKFKTHCVVDETAYEFNHFVNWVKKYYGISLTKQSGTIYRLDM